MLNHTECLVKVNVIFLTVVMERAPEASQEPTVSVFKPQVT